MYQVAIRSITVVFPVLGKPQLQLVAASVATGHLMKTNEPGFRPHVPLELK